MKLKFKNLTKKTLFACLLLLISNLKTEVVAQEIFPFEEYTAGDASNDADGDDNNTDDDSWAWTLDDNNNQSNSDSYYRWFDDTAHLMELGSRDHKTHRTLAATYFADSDYVDGASYNGTYHYFKVMNRLLNASEGYVSTMFLGSGATNEGFFIVNYEKQHKIDLVSMKRGYYMRPMSLGARNLSFNTGYGTAVPRMTIGDDLVNVKTEKVTLNYGGSNDLTQVSINTGVKVEGCALTIGGATHIGPKDGNLNSFDYDDKFSDYLLWVENGMVSEDFAIARATHWSDFVFEDTYEVPQLKEVESFIKENKHLPGIPSAKEVMEEGYSTHDMNAKFLQKIEELTLYTIAQEKKISDLEELLKKYEELSEKVAALEANSKN